MKDSKAEELKSAITSPEHISDENLGKVTGGKTEADYKICAGCGAHVSTNLLQCRLCGSTEFLMPWQ